MGCWDVFCFLCGNTCHSTLDGIEEYLLENVEYYESNNKKYKLFKPIYESYKKNPKLFISKLKKIEKNTNWLNKSTFLTANNKIVHGCKEVACNVTFEDKNGNSYSHGTGYEYDDIMYGVFIHTDCWKFVKNEYNIKLTYSHLPIIENNILSHKIFPFIDYGVIEKYWQQDFDFIRMIADSNEELCNSPLKSNLVAKNIKKIISKLKIKSDPERKGPIVSATFYKNGLYKVGINGNIWVTKNNKWNEIKDTIKLKINKALKDIVYSADVNDKPIFVLKNNSNKKIIEYEILTVK
jgi:hypothetical protein